MIGPRSTLLAALLAPVLVRATPVAAPAFTAAPTPQVAKRATSCTFSGSAGAASASASQAACATIVLSNVAVPAGTTLKLTAMQDNTKIIFQGETTWGYTQWAGPLLQIEGTGIIVEGASGATLNADGARWWDTMGSNGGKTKPQFFAAHNLIHSQINNLHIRNTPVQAVSIDGANDLTVTGMTIDCSDGDSAGGHNTDGFDIGSSKGVIINGATVMNQDDCIAINSGTNITMENSACSGGHGLSIGSVGGRNDNVVSDVTFYNNSVKNSVNGIRVKGTIGTTGTIKDVTYNKITLSSISAYGILIEQNYKNGDLRGPATTGVPITNLKIENISGSGAVASSGNDVVITCGSTTSCTGWTWTGVDVTGGSKYASCSNVPSGIACS